MKYHYHAWPGPNLEITVDKVDTVTGVIQKTKVTPHFRSARWWKARGFSFNGKISARAV